MPDTDRRHATSTGLLAGLVRSVIVIFALGMAATTIIVVIASGIQRRVVDQTSRESMRALVDVQARQLAASVADYTFWDDAIAALPSGGYDAAWWDLNLGRIALDNFDLSFAVAIDGSDRIRARSLSDDLGRPGVNPTTSLMALVRSARALPRFDAPDDRVATGIVSFAGTMHLAAASRFKPEAADSPPVLDSGATLVFAWPLAQVVADAAEVLGIDDVDVGATTPMGRSVLEFRTVDGGDVTTASWTPVIAQGASIDDLFVTLAVTFLMVGLAIAFVTQRARQLAASLQAETEQREALDAQRSSILESAGAGIFGVDASGRVTFANQAALDTLQVTSEAFVGKDPRRWLGLGQLPGLTADATQTTSERRSTLEQALSTRRTLDDGHAQVSEGEAMRGDGTRFPVEIVTSPVRRGAVVDGAVIVFRDVTERAKAEAEVRWRADHDVLTGLLSRARITQRIGDELVRARRSKSITGLLFLDLDKFKDVNDTLGHDAGDELLRQAAKRLRGSLREADAVGRMGGDEFVVMLPDLTAADHALLVAQKLLSALQERFEVHGNDAYVGASVGVAVHPDDGEDVGDLLRHADLALYRAKNGGRGQVVRYDPRLSEAANQRRALDLEIRRALRTGDMRLRVEPIVDVRTGWTERIAVQAHWHHGDLGPLMAEQFLPHVAATSVVPTLMKWTLEQALVEARRWQERANTGLDRRGGRPRVDGATPGRGQTKPAAKLGPWVSVDVIGVDASRSLSLEDLDEVLLATKVPASRLALEVPESQLASRDRDTRQWFHRLADRGVHLIVDDFSAGPDALDLLSGLPISGLKLNRSLLADIDRRDDRRTYVEGILAFARRMGLDVTAVGVDTQSQVDWLLQADGVLAQGHAMGEAWEARADAARGGWVKG